MNNIDFAAGLLALADVPHQDRGPITTTEVLRDASRRISQGPKAPQDMDLRELFDHVAIVNDAIRAALLTHLGMTPPKSEG